MTVSSRSAEILPRFYDPPIPPSSVLRLSPAVENFPPIFQVQKVITPEDPPSASPFGPSVGTRPRWANLFPLRTLKYLEILTKSKRWLRWKIRHRRVVLDLPVDRDPDRRLSLPTGNFEKFSKSNKWSRWEISRPRMLLDRARPKRPSTGLFFHCNVTSSRKKRSQ